MTTSSSQLFRVSQSEVDRYNSPVCNFSTIKLIVNVEDIISMTSQEIEKRKRAFSVVG